LGARPSSPTTGDKRARSPDERSDLRPTQAQKVNDNQGRPKARDYDDVTQELLAVAITWYRCLISTCDAFPDHETEREFAVQAWAKACEELKVAMPLEPTLAKLITKRGSQVRGELKTKVRAIVELVFGFESGQNKKNLRKNRQLAEDLKDGYGYCYRDDPSDPNRRKGLYKAKIIQKCANVMWFANRKDEGAMYPELFGPIFPRPAFAFILTVLDCGIDEWTTGTKTEVPFTAADYHSVYLEHLMCLDQYAKHTYPQRWPVRGYSYRTLTIALFYFRSFHSGAQPLEAAPTTGLSLAALEAAIKENDDEDSAEEAGDEEEGDEE
ncbi:hypothetical protein C8J57DRAFT_1088707, partial [Mycena rebaudengoi]